MAALRRLNPRFLPLAIQLCLLVALVSAEVIFEERFDGNMSVLFLCIFVFDRFKCDYVNANTVTTDEFVLFKLADGHD